MVKSGDSSARRDDPLLDVVVEILEAEGYDAVQLREVARRARTSLATIYKRYSTRDELILAALEAWMEEHRYSNVVPPPREPDSSLYDGLMALFRMIFEPWEQHPGMLAAFFRVRSGPSGAKLLSRGLDIVVPAATELLADVDEGFISDFNAAISSLVYGLMGRFSAGELTITELLPAIDRTVFWLTSGYESSGARHVSGRRGSTV